MRLLLLGNVKSQIVEPKLYAAISLVGKAGENEGSNREVQATDSEADSSQPKKRRLMLMCQEETKISGHPFYSGITVRKSRTEERTNVSGISLVSGWKEELQALMDQRKDLATRMTSLLTENEHVARHDVARPADAGCGMAQCETAELCSTEESATALVGPKVNR